MDEPLRSRLKRLGVSQGARHLRSGLKSPPDVVSSGRGQLTGATAALGQLFPGGRTMENGEGACFVLDRVYSAEYRHGDEPLGGLLDHNPQQARMLAVDEKVGSDFRDYVFLDTETTGLYGAGTYAFLVGVAYFDRASANTSVAEGSNTFITRQYFLRDPGDEAAMLDMLDQLLAHKAGLVTFNGRNFDLPLLDRRYLMNRMPGRVLEAPHIDLLPPARRLWRARLGSCALSALEVSLLSLQRESDDVPGAMIPALYLNYLRTGNARPLQGVFYHNQIDLLSMVTLLQRAIRQTAAPGDGDDPLDLLSLAKWHGNLGHNREAETIYRQAARTAQSMEHQSEAHGGLALLLKRDGRRQEALVHWQEAAAAAPDSLDYYVELAKYYEWHAGDLDVAIDWTRRALARIPTTAAHSSGMWQDELLHRLARLERKARGRGKR